MAATKPLILVRSYQKDDPEHSFITQECIDEFRPYFDFVCLEDVKSDASLLSLVRGMLVDPADAHMYLDVIPLMKNLGAIVGFGSGYDAYYPLYKPFGIPIANSPHSVTEQTADATMALVLTAGCRITEGMSTLKGPERRRYDCKGLQSIPGVAGKTMGIVGMGKIGFDVAKRANAFNMTILYHNRHRRPVEEEDKVGGVFHASLHVMLPACDYVVVTCPKTPETIALFGRKEFHLMKTSAIFVNISRGEVVNQDDLLDALKEGNIDSAALDVTYPEPLPVDHPLLKLGNVIITPHIAGCGHLRWQKEIQEALGNFKAALIDGKEMPNLIKV